MKHKIIGIVSFIAVMILSSITTLLLHSVIVDLTAPKKLYQAQLSDFRKSTAQVDSVLKQDPLKNPITLQNLLSSFGSSATSIYLPGFDLDKIKKEEPEEQDATIRSQLLQDKISKLEQRLDDMQTSQVSICTMIKAVLVWLLSAFMAPLITHWSKKSFGIPH